MTLNANMTLNTVAVGSRRFIGPEILVTWQQAFNEDKLNLHLQSYYFRRQGLGQLVFEKKDILAQRAGHQPGTSVLSQVGSDQPRPPTWRGNSNYCLDRRSPNRPRPVNMAVGSHGRPGQQVANAL